MSVDARLPSPAVLSIHQELPGMSQKAPPPSSTTSISLQALLSYTVLHALSFNL